jgi:hypothetical protein
MNNVLVSNANKYSLLKQASNCSSSHDVDWLICESRVGRSARERPLGISQHCIRQRRVGSARGLGKTQLFAHDDLEE